jgi:hypothetical protein
MSKNNFLTKNIQILKLVFKICKPLIFYVVIYLIANISINILELYLISYITKGLVNNIDKTMLLTNVLYITIITIVLMFFQTFYKDYLENKYRMFKNNYF